MESREQKRIGCDMVIRIQNTSTAVLLIEIKETLSLALKMTSTHGWKRRIGSMSC